MPQITSFWLDDDIVSNKDFKKIRKERGMIRKLLNELIRQHLLNLAETPEQLEVKIQSRRAELSQLEQQLLEMNVKKLPSPKQGEINDSQA